MKLADARDERTENGLRLDDADGDDGTDDDDEDDKCVK